MVLRPRIAMLLAVLGACALEESTDDELYDEAVSAVEGTFADAEADQHASRFNPHRRNHVDKGPLDRRTCLNEIARTRARKMADGQCPGDDSICHFDGLGNAITNKCPWDWNAWGENVGVGPSEFGLWQAFLGSAPHHANIDGQFNRFGVGAFRRQRDDLLFVVHVFARH